MSLLFIKFDVERLGHFVWWNHTVLARSHRHQILKYLLVLLHGIYIGRHLLVQTSLWTFFESIRTQITKAHGHWIISNKCSDRLLIIVDLRWNASFNGGWLKVFAHAMLLHWSKVRVHNTHIFLWWFLNIKLTLVILTGTLSTFVWSSCQLQMVLKVFNFKIWSVT